MELIFLFLVVALLYFVASSGSLPEKLSVGYFFLYTAGLSFSQSLVRDVTILVSHKKTSADNQRECFCLCLESSFGLIVLVIGLVLSFLLQTPKVLMDTTRWISWTTLILLFSFAIKDYVLLLNPIRIEKDRNHLNIILRWKK